MNWLDIAIIGIITITALIGLWHGLIKTVLSLAGVIVGVILAGKYYMPLSEQLTFIPQENLAKITAFAIILIGVMIVALILAKVLKWVTSMLMLGWINRLGGAVFGLIMGAITCGSLLAALMHFLGPFEIITQSILANILLDIFPIILSLLPEEFDTIRTFF